MCVYTYTSFLSFCPPPRAAWTPSANPLSFLLRVCLSLYMIYKHIILLLQRYSICLEITEVESSSTLESAHERDLPPRVKPEWEAPTNKILSRMTSERRWSLVVQIPTSVSCLAIHISGSQNTAKCLDISRDYSRFNSSTPLSCCR